MADELKDSNWTVKTSNEVKKEIESLLSTTNLNNKELFEAMVSNFKSGLLQGSDAQRSEDIQQLTYHLDKIKNSFLSLVEKGIDLKAKFSESLEQESILHKSITDQQQLQIKQAEELKNMAIQEREEISKTLSDIATRNNELEEINTTQRTTINMLQEKIIQLESKIEAVPAIEQENQIQAKKIEAYKQELNEVNQELNEANRELSFAHKSTASTIKEKERSIEQLQQIHQLEMDKAIISTEKRMLEDTQKIRNEYTSKIDALISKNQELTERCHTLELQQGTKSTKQ
jgi:chromosome segregation ATPase